MSFDRRGSWATAAALALLAAGCALGLRAAGVAPRGAPTSWRDFTHKTHTDKEAECADCHGDVAKGGEPRMPDKAICAGCHEAEEDPAKTPPYTQSILAAEAIAYTPRGEVEGTRFAHAQHLAHASKPACADCHGDIAHAVDITAAHTVEQAECASCHERQTVARGCAGCHAAERFALEPPSHGTAWVRRHGREARTGLAPQHGAGCLGCHAEDHCADCHRAEKPASHTQTWRYRTHGLYASLDREACMTCHVQDACVQCHEETPPRSHRPGWGQTRERHCLSCHEPLAGESCVACHPGTPSHALAPLRPMNAAHATATESQCLLCHVPLPHPDAGQGCTGCHR